MRFVMMIKSDEQAEAGALPDDKLVEAMNRYNQDLLDAGALLAAEGLHPTSQGARVKFHDGKPTITDGPFAEAKEVVAGYWVIQANSKQEAIAWARRVPFEAGESPATSGGTAQVEVRQVYELEDFPVGDVESGWREMEAQFRTESGAGPASPGGTGRQNLPRFVIFRMADRQTETGVMPGEPLLAAMGRYNQDMIDAGVFVDGMGLQPTAKGARVNYSNGQRTVVDGPFTEAKELVAGFTIIQARSKEEALAWVKRWPPLDANGELELHVRQIFDSEEFEANLTPELRAAEERQRAQLQRRQ